MSQSSDDGVPNPVLSSDEEMDEDLPAFSLTAPSGSAAASAVDTTKRAADGEDAGATRSKRFREGSELQKRTERRRVEAEEAANARRMQQLIKQRAKVHEKALPTPKSAATEMLKDEPNRAETARIYKELEGKSMKEIKRDQQARAMSMATEGVRALSADNQAAIKSTQIKQLPEMPPAINVFPLGHSRHFATLASSDPATNPAPDLTELIADVHRLAHAKGGDEILGQFLRSGAIAAVGARAQLPVAVADWLVGVAAWHSDTAVVRACITTLQRCFLDRPIPAGGEARWQLSPAHLAAALCAIGATPSTLLLDGCPLSPAAAVDRSALPPPAGPQPERADTAALPLLNLQAVIEVVELAARAGAVGGGAESVDAASTEAILLMLFRLMADHRTIPVVFGLERAVTELLHQLPADVWGPARDRLATALVESGGHFHQLLRTMTLLSSQGGRCTELRRSICRTVIPTLFPELELKLPGPGSPVDDVAYFDVTLARLTPHVTEISKDMDGVHRLFCLHQLMDASTPIAPLKSADVPRVENFRGTVTAHSAQFKGEYDLTRADIRDALHSLRATEGRLKNQIAHSAPAEKSKQATLAFGSKKRAC